jgi:hypothetical protein
MAPIGQIYQKVDQLSTSKCDLLDGHAFTE